MANAVWVVPTVLPRSAKNGLFDPNFGNRDKSAYYQIDIDTGSLVISPSHKTSKLVSTPFMDTNFRGTDQPVFNVDGTDTGVSAVTRGFTLSSVYSLTNFGNVFEELHFNASLIGKQINASK